MNQLLWYYADLEKQKCLEDIETDSLSPTDLLQHIGGRKSNKVQQYSSLILFSTSNHSMKAFYERSEQIVIEINHCLAYRKFAK